MADKIEITSDCDGLGNPHPDGEMMCRIGVGSVLLVLQDYDRDYYKVAFGGRPVFVPKARAVRVESEETREHAVPGWKADLVVEYAASTEQHFLPGFRDAAGTHAATSDKEEARSAPRKEDVRPRPRKRSKVATSGGLRTRRGQGERPKRSICLGCRREYLPGTVFCLGCLFSKRSRHSILPGQPVVIVTVMALTVTGLTAVGIFFAVSMDAPGTLIGFAVTTVVPGVLVAALLLARVIFRRLRLGFPASVLLGIYGFIFLWIYIGGGASIGWGWPVDAWLDIYSPDTVMNAVIADKEMIHHRHCNPDSGCREEDHYYLHAAGRKLTVSESTYEGARRGGCVEIGFRPRTKVVSYVHLVQVDANRQPC